MIKFITDVELENPLTFNMVEEHQFFVCQDGYLCQKLHRDKFNIVADSFGRPCALRSRDYYTDEIPIRKILSKVTKIEF